MSAFLLILQRRPITIVVKQLKERNWINERKEKKLGKGRPYKVLSYFNT